MKKISDLNWAWQAKELRRVADNMVQLGKEVATSTQICIHPLSALGGKMMIGFLFLSNLLKSILGATVGHFGCTAKSCCGYPWGRKPA